MSVHSRMPALLVGLGAILTAVLVGEAVAHVLVPWDELSLLFFISATTTAPFILACVYGGYWLSRSDLPTDRYPRVGAWALGGLVGFLFLNGLTMLAVELENVFFLIGWLRWAAALGAGTGTAIGIIEARAIQRAVVAERARVRAAEAESREELLTYLHDLLRHKVRNAVNAIDGHAALMAERGDEDGTFLEAIHRQTSELSRITREVRTFMEASGSAEDFHPVDLCAVLREEVGEIDSHYETVDIELECADGVAVPGDELLHRAFRNLLLDASVHDPAEVSHVGVSVETDGDTVTICIADDGSEPAPGEVDPSDAFDLNEGGTPERGLGLPLGRILIERCGGEVGLTEAGADGAALVVTLPRSPRSGRGETRQLAGHIFG